MAAIQDTTLVVQGMTCPSCIRHVESALRSLEGIAAIDVNLADGKVRVRHDASRASIAKLVAALAEAGYESRA